MKLFRPIVIILFAYCLLHISDLSKKNFSTTNTYIRDRVVKLENDLGECSGVQVKAHSGKSFILTAAHCGHLNKDGFITVIAEDGNHYEKHILAEDDKADLLILEGIDSLSGLEVAANLIKTQVIRTFTHGHNLDTYMTEGVVIQESLIEPSVGLICPNSSVKYRQRDLYDIFTGQNIPGCYMSEMVTVTTALVVPGSSGGCVVDVNDELVGIVSATDGTFGYMVPIRDVQRFLKDF